MASSSSSSSSSSSPTAIPPWLDLPREITASILRRLDVVDRLTTVEKVCKLWREVCLDPAMWRSIEMRHTGDIWEEPCALDKMCFLAVDRSQAQLTHIKLEYFGNDFLLRFISRRCKELRRLELVFSFGVTDDGLIEAVKNLPSLEELHLYRLYYFSIDAETIKSIGQFCPKLKTFKFNHRWYKGPHVLSEDFVALAIAEAMPELRNLQLLGNKLTNEGLQAILDGCPHLESLDLRQCLNVHLDESLERLCSQRIKDLKRPYDSTDDNDPFDAEMIGCNTSNEDDDSISGFSDVDMVSDVDEDAEFSGGSSSNEDDDDDFDAYDFYDDL